VITELYFAVYNRWGEKIFETTSQDIGWDGTFKGQALSPDVYGYYLRYKCIGQSASDKAQFKKGNVTLIR
jgi:gliding motility-associated-like protein